MFLKNVATASQVDFFRISRIFQTCFYCFSPANTIEKNLVELVLLSHILAIFKVSRQYAYDRDL